MSELFALLMGLWVATTSANITTENYNGREILVHLPTQLPQSGSRALVIVLHGGMGNAQRVESAQSESGLNLDSIADKNGFIVAYLNGTPVTRFLGNDKLGWNAGGGCCGLPARNNTDDVAYIKGAVDYLVKKYGIDSRHIFGMGHSNGAMMTQRLMCETNLYSSAVAISGPLNLPVTRCPAAQGKHLLSLHGANDANVPVAGGKGTQGLSQAIYSSEEHSRQIFTQSGATYDLEIIPGADHTLDHIDASLQKSEGKTIGQKAVSYFGLLK